MHHVMDIVGVIIKLKKQKLHLVIGTFQANIIKVFLSQQQNSVKESISETVFILKNNYTSLGEWQTEYDL